MSEIKNILCPVDFSKCSERALDYAVGMANLLGAHLHLVHAYVDPLASIPFGRTNTWPPAAPPEAVTAATQERAQQVAGPVFST